MKEIFNFNNTPIWKLDEALDKIDKSIIDLAQNPRVDQRVKDRCLLKLEKIKERAEQGIKLFTEENK